MKQEKCKQQLEEVSQANSSDEPYWKQWAKQKTKPRKSVIDEIYKD